jgi:hypothetical protein
MTEVVVASKMDSFYIYYRCNHCCTKGNRVVSGQAFKPNYHIHNSDDDFGSRDLLIHPLCLFSRGALIMRVTDETTRIRLV